MHDKQEEEWQLLITAYHEAGHIVAAAVLGIPMEDASIEHDDRSFGRVGGMNPIAGCDPDNLTPAEQEVVERMMVVHLAGYFAEAIITDERGIDSAQGDIQKARDSAALLGIQPHAAQNGDEHFRLARSRTRMLILECVQLIMHVANSLITHRNLTTQQIGAVTGGECLTPVRAAVLSKWLCSIGSTDSKGK